jgi:TonB family protein
MCRNIRTQIRSLAVLLAYTVSGVLASSAQEANSAAPSGLQALAIQAIHVVVTQEALNPFNLEPKTGKPLSKNGKWLVGNQAPAACPNTTQSCVRVLYRVPEANVSCEWVVLLIADGSQGQILEQNADASQYFLQRLGPDETKTLVLNRKGPTYPPIAAAAHVQGEVELLVIVDQNGKPSNVSILSGPEMLRAASIEALKGWTFKPFQVGSGTVPFQTIVKFTFRTVRPPSESITSEP